ncbi:hypothetical protein P4571_01200 [Niallia alba]|uniref:hypothetical protein n=1 Tax=Niallia alba TaxID=2729105 RepID=UPI002E22E672|nr:hypothetical protein [Niallia alba]
MNQALVKVLVKAKELNKWVPASLLKKYDIQSVNLLELEESHLILTKRNKSEGLLLKLTLKGYHYFKQK